MTELLFGGMLFPIPTPPRSCMTLTPTHPTPTFCNVLPRNPAVEEQAIDRIHRLGQLNDVSVKRFVVSETVEDKMLALQVRSRYHFYFRFQSIHLCLKRLFTLYAFKAIYLYQERSAQT